MNASQTYQEEISSQVPAVQLLMKLGWHYLSPNEALALRNGKASQVVLTGILKPWLAQHNQINYRKKHYPFTDTNIQEAIERLVNEPFQSLQLTNERIYELLTLGTSLTQTIANDRKSYSLHYIDWQHPERNVYHVTEEFVVERQGSHATRRPDIVLFVNGIPFVVIECKRPDLQNNGDKPVNEAISQMLRNQLDGEIPHLFLSTQLLLAICGNDAVYGTTGTKKEFWTHWHEEGADLQALHQLVNTPLSHSQQDQLYAWRKHAGALRHHFAQLGERVVSPQDQLIAALLQPQRLLEIAYQFIVYDNGNKKIARYQQYFAIKATIERVTHLNAQGQRTGGVIWHTTGSGKSLTMVMLAKALSLIPSIRQPRIVLVTDRVDLDDQIWRTFKACGKSVAQANDGGHLIRLITNKLNQGEPRPDIITTVINKFEQAAKAKQQDNNPDVFVLVDESHRSQYGTMHAKMQQVFPNACLIGFTGTPLTKNEKSTTAKFGGFIHKYPIRQAVADQTVVPLLYEGRIVPQEVNKQQLERWFDRVTAQLTEEQRSDLKRRMSQNEAISTTEQRIEEIAYNIAQHYKENFQGTGWKAQVACSTKRVALKYLKYLREHDIDAELVISPPDTREGYSEIDGDAPEIHTFWSNQMKRFGSEDAANKAIISSFARADGTEILVVVDKLLTGFDEPRNTVLYIDKPLKEHTLLQAIARVNRIAEGKDFGYIIDYRGVLGELNSAMDVYDTLAEYDSEDIEGILQNISGEIARLPQLHSELWAVFAGVSNKKDREALEQHLAAEDHRQRFYEILTDYARVLRVALASVSFYENTAEALIQTYKNDLQFFHKLRYAVKLRYAEMIDYSEYEEKVSKLLDTHVQASATEIITQLVNIFDVEQFDAEVERLSSPVAKADTILHRLKRTITERMDEDPALYRSFAEMVEQAIEEYRQGRLEQREYLEKAQEILHQVRTGHSNDQPAELLKYRHAPAYYGIIHEPLASYGLSNQQIAELAIQQEKLIEEQKVTDWVNNLDVQKSIKRRLDHQFYEVEKIIGTELNLEQIDAMIDQVVEVAKARDMR